MIYPFLFHFLPLFSFSSSPHPEVTQTLCERGSSYFYISNEALFLCNVSLFRIVGDPGFYPIILTGQMYWYPTNSRQYISTGTYSVSLASHARNAERYHTSISCDPFLKNAVLQGERQHIMHNIPAATIPATSAGGHHVLSTLDALH